MAFFSPPNTLRWLIDHYRESSSWKAFSPAARKQRENIFLNVIKRSNNTLYTAIDRKFMVAAVEARSETPAQANHFLKAMRGVFSWALQNDYVAIDSTAGVLPLKYKSAGFAPWTMTDLLQFFDRWPIGSKPRLAVEIAASYKASSFRRSSSWLAAHAGQHFHTQNSKDRLCNYH